MVHLTGCALPNLIEDHNANSSSSLFDDLRHLNTLHDHRDHNRSDGHSHRSDELSSARRSAPAQRRSRPISTARGPRPLLPRSLKEALQLAELLSKSKLIPKGFETPETCLVGILYGMEVGLSPIAALQRMAVIDGRPTIWGDAALALVQSSGLLISIREEIVEDEHTKILSAICRVEREGRSEPVTGTFSVDDAKRAGLWQKPGPWTDYPKRMLTMRARAFALRDAFPDVLAGLYIREEFESSGKAYEKQASDLNESRLQSQCPKDDAEWDRIGQENEFGQTNPNRPRENKGLANCASHSHSENSQLSGIFATAVGAAAPSKSHSTTNDRVRESQYPSAVRRAPPPPPEVAKNAEEKLEVGSSSEFASSNEQNLANGDQDAFDPEIILDLFDSALCCALDLSTLEEIIDEFAERLRKLPDDAQQRAQRIIERHQKRVEDLDRSPATDQSASAGPSKADHNQLDHGADQHEAGSDADFNAGNEATTLPRGLKPLLPNLGLGNLPVMRRRRKSREARSRSLASWNARTQLSNLNQPLRDEVVSFVEPTETEE